MPVSEEIRFSELSRLVESGLTSYILSVLGQPQVVEANDTLDADIGRTKKDSACDETTSKAINGSSSEESHPVEVVEAPETSEDGSAGDASLLCRSVQTDTVEKS